MTRSVHLVRANSGHRIVRMGFCWTGFFLPGLRAISEGLWRVWALQALWASLVTFFHDAAEDFQRHSHPGVSSFLSLCADLSAMALVLTMLCCGMFGKRWLVASLFKRGYVEHPSSASAA